MSWKITINDRNGKYVAETDADWNLVRAYLVCCRNVTFVDEQAGQAALVKKLPDAHSEAESDLLEEYGVNTLRNIENAYLMLLCLIGGCLCVALAVIFELINK